MVYKKKNLRDNEILSDYRYGNHFFTDKVVCLYYIQLFINLLGLLSVLILLSTFLVHSMKEVKGTFITVLKTYFSGVIAITLSGDSEDNNDDLNLDGNQVSTHVHS